jgi:ribose transport system ATP-binding protein
MSLSASNGATGGSPPHVGGAAVEADPALAIRGLSKTFVVSKALDEVGFTVEPGRIHALLGGNGSGKSTLIKILAGVYRGDPGGEIDVGATTVASDATTPALAREMGLRFVHQDPGIFPELTIAENIGLANGWPTRAGGVRWGELHRRTAALLELFEIHARPEARMDTLSAPLRTMVAIARALEDADGGLSVLVLDEPTASLPQHEVELLLEAVRARAAYGQTILYVSHRIDEVMSIADSVTVLRDGREIVSRSTEGLTEDQLIEYIVGRPLESVFQASPDVNRGSPVLELEGVSAGMLQNIDLAVREGEIVGLAGLLGSGRTELLQLVFGARTRDSGTIRLAGREIDFVGPQDAIAAGVAYVPEDRALEAAFMEMTVKENLSVADLARYWGRLRFNHGRERRDAIADIERFEVKAAGDGALFASLSGGNQQKVILARWLRRGPRLLLLDEPTQGVDVGARADVYATIDEAVANGLGVLIVSSDFEELARVSDRILILRDGSIVAQLQSARDGEQIVEAIYTAREQRK